MRDNPMKWFIICMFSGLMICSCKNEKTPDDKPDVEEISFIISEHIYPGSAVQSIVFNSSGGYFYSVGNQINLKESGKQVVSFSANSEVYSMAFNLKDSSLYFGIKESGLGRLHNNTITYFTVENSGLPRNLVSKVVCDAAGNVWFNSSASKLGGLMKYNGKTMEKFLPENSALPGNIVYDITAYGGDVFVSAEDPKGGFFIMKISGNSWSQVLHSKGCYIFQKLEVDHEGRIYYTDDSREYCGGGLMSDFVLFSFINGEKVVLREGNPGTEFTPYILKSDKQNCIWQAKFYKEEYETLSFYNRKEWIKAPVGFPHDHIRCIEIDDENKVWLGTDNGIYILIGNK
jgi:ligand-binding sensor domain-containing protein